MIPTTAGVFLTHNVSSGDGRNPAGAARARFGLRVGAKFLDLFLALVVALVLPYPIGPLLAFAYSLFGDGLPIPGWAGQSLGKRALGLRAVNAKTGRGISFRESALRNSPVGVVTFFALIPFWGWLILLVIGAPLLAMELYLMFGAPGGRRLGDVMGETEVVSV